VLKLARRPSTESSLDLLAEAGELLGRGGCQPTQRRDGVVTLLPVGDATDEVAGTVQRVVDATSQGVGASEPVGCFDLQPEQLVAPVLTITGARQAKQIPAMPSMPCCWQKSVAAAYASSASGSRRRAPGPTPAGSRRSSGAR
jgi:hypothetical protein